MRKLHAFDPKKTPAAFSMTFHPKLVGAAKPITLRFVRASDNGEACYIGTAVNEWGHHVGGGTIIIHQDLRTVGGRAFSHILTGGDRRRKLSNNQFAAERMRFVTELWHLMLHLQEVEARDEEEALSAVVGAALHFRVKVEQGSMTEEDLRDLTLLGAPLWVVDSLVELGYRPVIDPKEVAKKYAKSHATTVQDGEWDPMANSLAYTHTVPFGVVQFLQRNNVRYALIQQRRAR